MSPGSSSAVTTVERSSGSPNSSRPSAATPARVARASRSWRAKTFSRPSASIRSSATSRPWKRVTGGREGRVALALGLRGPDPVEVVAAARPCLRRSRARSGRRRRTPGRAGSSAPSGEPATTTSTPHSSCLSSAAPRPETASTTRSAPRRLTDLGDRLDVVDDAGGGLRERGEDHLDAGFSAAGGRSPSGPGARPSPARSGRCRRRRPRASSIQRSPNLPAAQTRTFVPGRTRFAAAESMAPEPLAANVSTSLLVWKTFGSLSSTRS